MLPLFKIDDKKVKSVIKDAVGAKEGDFNGQKMLMGTTVNPVVVINGDFYHRPSYVISQVPVQNTWYTLFDLTGGVRLLKMIVHYDLDEAGPQNVAVRWTIDGYEYLGTQAAVKDSDYYLYRDQVGLGDGTNGIAFTTTICMPAYYGDLRGHDFKAEVRTTAAVGTNPTLRAWAVVETLGGNKS